MRTPQSQNAHTGNIVVHEFFLTRQNIRSALIITASGINLYSLPQFGIFSRMNLLVTAGPTREALDPARYLTNRSSGRMGYALAGAGVHNGHRVTLISGPTALDVPHGVDFIPVESAQEMYDAVQSMCGKADAAILCAAVADYRPIQYSDQKIKKSGDKLILELEKTPDILGSMRDTFGYDGVLIGFAAETQEIESYAKEKLVRKKCDLIIANDVSRCDIGFDASENEVLLVYPGKSVLLPRDTKEHLALQIINCAETLLDERNSQ